MVTTTSEDRTIVFLTPRRLESVKTPDVEFATSRKQVLVALGRERVSTVWVERGHEQLLNFLVHTLAERTGSVAKSRHMLLALSSLRAFQNATFGTLFDRAITSLPQVLPPDELAEALAADSREDLCVGGFVDEGAGIVTLIRGNLESLVVPLDSFEQDAEGCPEPAFSRFSVKDYGQTLAFGDYEAAFDAVLYERDPDYRRRKKQESLEADTSFGASIRRLRTQRKLARTDFPGVPERTLARIERGEVNRPQAGTLRKIAATLRVPVEELGSY